MNSELYKTLVDKKLIAEGVILYGKVYTLGFGNMPSLIPKKVQVIQPAPDGVICQDSNKRRHLIKIEHIESVDGMEPSRFAAVYNIKADGSAKAIGKKRGRKPKVNT